MALLPNLAVALLVFVAFYFAGKVANRLAKQVGTRFATNEAVVRLLASVMQYTVLAVGFVVALGVIGLQKAVVSILAGAGVAIGYGFTFLVAPAEHPQSGVTATAPVVIAQRPSVVELPDFLSMTEGELVASFMSLDAFQLRRAIRSICTLSMN